MYGTDITGRISSVQEDMDTEEQVQPLLDTVPDTTQLKVSNTDEEGNISRVWARIKYRGRSLYDC